MTASRPRLARKYTGLGRPQSWVSSLSGPIILPVLACSVSGRFQYLNFFGPWLLFGGHLAGFRKSSATGPHTLGRRDTTRHTLSS